MIYLFPYRTGSNSVRALAEALPAKIIKLEGSKFRYKPGRRVINWGSCQCPPSYNALNPSQLTTLTRDKLKTFRLFTPSTLPDALQASLAALGGMQAPRIPRWTTSRQEASQWLSDGMKKIVCRASLTGQSGSGISVITRSTIEPQPELPQVPLYVEYIGKDAEFRLHVFKINGTIEVLDVQRKIRDPEREPSNWDVRSHANGFIFTRNDLDGRPHMETVPEDVRVQAKRALACSGLDFGAVDACWNKKRNQAFVFEINSAPGLEGQSIEVYRDALRRMLA